MAYLDYTGLQTLWAKIKNTFALKSHEHNAAEITSGTVESERLPVASTTQAGIVQVGDNLSINTSGKLSAKPPTNIAYDNQKTIWLVGDARTNESTEPPESYKVPALTYSYNDGLVLKNILTIGMLGYIAFRDSDDNLYGSIDYQSYTGKADTAGTADNALAVPWTGVTGKPDWIGDSLPTASASTLGGVKVGDGLSITSAGVLSATGGSGGSVANVGKVFIASEFAYSSSDESYKVTLSDTTNFLNSDGEPDYGTRVICDGRAVPAISSLVFYDSNDTLLFDSMNLITPYGASYTTGISIGTRFWTFTWAGDGWLVETDRSESKNVITGVKGNSESTYRTGNVNLTAANIGAAASSHTHAAGDITSGTLSAARGGTGYTTLQATRSAMGLGNTTGAVPIANGGTGSTTAANARSALGITCANIGAATSGHTHTGAAAANDYVTAQGLSSSWYYRKWNSGKKECWRMYSFTTGTMSSSGDIYYYEATMPAYPWTWSSLQNLQVSAYCQYPMWCAENSTNRTTSHPGNVTVFRTSAVNNKTVYLQMYAYGW